MSTNSSIEDKRSTVQTVSRGLQVLRAFRSERSPLSNSDLVRRTGLSKATVSRLTSTLLQLGFLNHTPESRRFELAAGPLGMGHAFVESSGLLRQLDVPMQELADRLGGSAALAVPNDLDMLYVIYRAAPKVATLRLGAGSMLPMGMTAIGHAYLWSLPAAEQREQISRIKKHVGGSYAGSVDQGICNSFAELDSTGTCCVADGYLRDTFGFALPVRLGRDETLMALSCGRAAVRPDLAAESRRLAPALKHAAQQFQQLLLNVDGPP
jgi:IclR family transcriptional regulator, positive regulator for flagellar biogenesis